MNVIHVAVFGKLRYMHVVIDTYSGFLMTTIHTGEAISMCLQLRVFFKCGYCCLAMAVRNESWSTTNTCGSLLERGRGDGVVATTWERK